MTQPQPLTPAAQAVLDAAVKWAAPDPSNDGHQAGTITTAIDVELLDAIRRWREEQGT